MSTYINVPGNFRNRVLEKTFAGNHAVVFPSPGGVVDRGRTPHGFRGIHYNTPGRVMNRYKQATFGM